MPQTPNREHGELLVPDGLVLEEALSDPTQQGGIRYNGTAFRLRDSVGVFDPRTGGSGITQAQHEALDTLVHDIDETSYEEVTYTGSNPTLWVAWTDNTKVLKIREEQYSYTGSRISQVVTIQYDGSGAEVMRTTEVYTYVNGRVVSIQRTKVP